MKNFLEIDSNNLKNSTLVLDIDGTIVSDKSNKIKYKIVEKIKELAHKNKIYLCSNGSQSRVAKFAEVLNASVIEGKKPFSVKMPEIKKESKIVVIGDKYLTDGLFARSINAEFLKVRHLTSNTDTTFIKFSYFMDNLVYSTILYFKLMRPWQWVKNLFIFAPLFFAGTTLVVREFFPALLAFFTFSLASSCVYIFNDIRDEKSDALHPKKKNRPIAAGLIPKSKAWVALCVLIIGTILFSMFVAQIILPLILYLSLNALYSWKLKHIVILDIIVVSIFYLLRLMAGGLATGVPLSPWIIICVFFGALFIILGKRRAEHAQENRRSVLEDYSVEALNFMLGISASLAIITYGIWSVIEHDSPYLVYSTIFVVFVFFKILNKIYTHTKEVESPEIMVFKDKWILSTFLIWLIYVFFVFYI